MPHLFSPLTLRSVTLRNRIAVSPMCQYSSEDGFANDWHLVHLGARAQGGAGLVITEAAAVEPRGRISPQDLGIWDDAHVEFLARINSFIHSQGSVAGIQIAHAGRKASTRRPWEGRGPVPPEEGGWAPVVSASDRAWDAGYPETHALTVAEIEETIAAFVAATRRSLAAGFRVVELNAAHGYHFHQFLTPLTNFRTDAYGGSFENRTRIVRDTVSAVRGVWPDELPLLLRISATDWTEGGWTPEDSVALAKMVAPLGVDFIDCSSGAAIPKGGAIPVGPGYQVPLAEQVRRESGVPTGAVGMIIDPQQADRIIREEQADLVLLARELLRDPHWPLRAAHALGQEGPWPPQYERAKWAA